MCVYMSVCVLTSVCVPFSQFTSRVYVCEYVCVSLV